MNKTLVKVGFTLCFILFVLAGWLKIIHADNANTLLMFGLIASYLCLSITLFEVVFSKKMKRKDKVLWLFAFIATGWFAMLIYAFVYRKNVNTNAEPNNGLRTT